MTIEDIIKELGCEVYAGASLLQRPVKGVYASDLLSDVMGRAREGELWVTMQTHKNIIAVASLKDLAAILIVNGGRPDEDTRQAADAENIVLLGSNAGTYKNCGLLYKLIGTDAMVSS
ncbi:MAG: serine kinase [Bacteroidales bacterium]